MTTSCADDGSSRVWGSLQDGVFEGVIDSPKHGGRWVAGPIRHTDVYKLYSSKVISSYRIKIEKEVNNS